MGILTLCLPSLLHNIWAGDPPRTVYQCYQEVSVDSGGVVIYSVCCCTCLSQAKSSSRRRTPCWRLTIPRLLLQALKEPWVQLCFPRCFDLAKPENSSAMLYVTVVLVVWFRYRSVSSFLHQELDHNAFCSFAMSSFLSWENNSDGSAYSYFSAPIFGQKWANPPTACLHWKLVGAMSKRCGALLEMLTFSERSGCRYPKLWVQFMDLMDCGFCIFSGLLVVYFVILANWYKGLIAPIIHQT